MSAALEFAITHRAPDEWMLSKWVPGGWFRRGQWVQIELARTEAEIKEAMKRHSTPHRPTTKYYDKYGGEDAGDGW